MTSPYIERRNGGLYVAGTRVSLASVVHAFERGASPETILDEYPAIGSLSKVYGAITFILESPEEVDRYLEQQQDLWDQLRRDNPLPPAMVNRFEAARRAMRRKSA